MQRLSLSHCSFYYIFFVVLHIFKQQKELLTRHNISWYEKFQRLKINNKKLIQMHIFSKQLSLSNLLTSCTHDFLKGAWQIKGKAHMLNRLACNERRVVYLKHTIVNTQSTQTWTNLQWKSYTCSYRGLNNFLDLK